RHQAGLLVQPDRLPQRVDDGPRRARVPRGRLRGGEPAVHHVLRRRRAGGRRHRRAAQRGLRRQHAARAVAGGRPDARRQRADGAQPRAVRGGPRGPRRHERPAAHAGSGGGPMTGAPPFAVISGAQVQRALQGREKQVVELVEATYRLHGAGDSVNPPSYFLRFPDRPTARIIALPASSGGPLRVDGIKWGSSLPGNVQAGSPRASAVLILNDHDTGYPFACVECSIINATRTAASAALGADRLSQGRPRPTRVGFVGTGLIARYIHTYLARTGWTFDEVGVHDLSPASAAGFRGYLERSG